MSKFIHLNQPSLRAVAWRNIMVASINAAIDQKLVSLNSIDGEREFSRPKNEVFQFEIMRIKGIGCLADAGHDEVRIFAALWPSDNADYWIRGEGGFKAGEAFASGWLERRSGSFLQTHLQLKCRQHRLDEAAAIQVAAKGYNDAGRFMH